MIDDQWYLLYTPLEKPTFQVNKSLHFKTTAPIPGISSIKVIELGSKAHLIVLKKNLLTQLLQDRASQVLGTARK